MKPQPLIIRPRPLIDARSQSEIDAFERAHIKQAERNARRGDAPPATENDVLVFDPNRRAEQK